jgi:hypothetical protein
MGRLIAAHVKNGVIVTDEDIELPEGAQVTVAMNDEHEGEVELSPEEIAELDAAEAEIDKGDFVTTDVVLAELERITAARK